MSSPPHDRPGRRSLPRVATWTALALLLVAACGRTSPPPPKPSTPPDAPPAASTVASAAARGAELVQRLGPEAPAPTVTVAPLPDATVAAIERAVAGAVGRETPGAVVLVTRPEGVAYLRAFGHRQVEPSRAPMTTETSFDLASLTKPVVTATATMRLVDAGRWSLADPVKRLRPSFDAGGVTLAHLLAHESGLPAANPLSAFANGPAAAWRAIDQLRLQHRPGSKRLYSDVGYLLLGRLLPQPLEATAQVEIFEPLGMSHATFHPTASDVIATERRDGAMLVGQVHDPRAAALGGVAGHAGLFAPAGDLGAWLRMLLRSGVADDGTRFLSKASVDTLLTPRGDGRHSLAFSHYAGGAQHTGFTGQLVWLSRSGALGVALLTTRLHPDGRGDVTALRRAVRNAVAEAGRLAVRPGTDRVAAEPSLVVGPRVAVLTNRGGVTRGGRRLVDVIHHAAHLELKTILTPEHGLAARAEGAVDDGHDAATGVPIVSLYGKRERPPAGLWSEVDEVVVDLPDVGARFFTYATTVGLLLEEAAKHDVRVRILDRPNPLGGEVLEGPVLDADHRSFVAYHPVPIRHGLTLGELARLVVNDKHLEVDLELVLAEGWKRSTPFSGTGLPWRPPSPNLPTLTAAQLYPGVALVEMTNVSVGRGTDRPFQRVGAPWMDGDAVAESLRQHGLAGVEVAVESFTPTASRFAGQRCRGIRFDVRDASALRPVRLGVALALALREHHEARWNHRRLMTLVGHRATVAAIVAGEPLETIVARWQPELDAFARRRRSILAY